MKVSPEVHQATIKMIGEHRRQIKKLLIIVGVLVSLLIGLLAILWMVI